ncbi:MAG TPA: hypothetical protein VJB10_00420 [Candidatus Peribacteraceae bacterium]|nr:hypothetical protein [Candidatus Peribacteraceae bacterium]
MNRFEFLPGCEKEMKRLLKKYRTLDDDLGNLKSILDACPTGIGKNFTVLHAGKTVTVVKVRMACRALHDRSLRMIYAYHERERAVVFIELYFKGDKENEDRRRIEEYLRNL